MDSSDGDDGGPVRTVVGAVDLVAAVVAAVAAATVALAPAADGSVLELVGALLLVFALPGYATVAALLPRRTAVADVAGEVDADGDARRGVDRIERVALSVALSVCIAGLVGLGWTFTPGGLRRWAIVGSLSGVTILVAGVGAYRRWAHPDVEFTVTARESRAAPGGGVGWLTSGDHLAFRALLALSVLVVASTAVYSVSTPIRGETYTEFYVVAQNETGALVAGSYPAGEAGGENATVVVGVANHEKRTVAYRLVVESHRVRVADGETMVVEQRRVRAHGVTLAAGEAARIPVALPASVGVRADGSGSVERRTRLVFLLYRGSVPADPSAESAYRSLHVWLDGNRSAAGNASATLGAVGVRTLPGSAVPYPARSASRR